MEFSVMQYGVPFTDYRVFTEGCRKIFVAKADHLVVDFHGQHDWIIYVGSHCKLETGKRCVFQTGSYCEFNTDSDCTFTTASNCTFVTNVFCTFNVGANCSINTGAGGAFKTGEDCTVEVEEGWSSYEVA